MPRTLVVAEKPSVGSDIAKVLGCRDRKKGYIEGDSHIVTWAIGHLVTLCSPEEMDDSLKEWKFETLPMLPDEMKLKIVGRTREQFFTVKRLMLQNDVEDIVCATDSGREGELIFRYIYKVSGCAKPFTRLWISSMTDEAIRDGLAGLKPGGDYDNLYQSARCRAEADWLVGMNGSRGYTLQYDRLLSVGRVQSPTLAIMVKREREIQNFIPEKYWELWATFNGYKGRWFDEKEDAKSGRIPQDRLQWAQKLAEDLKGKPYKVEKIEREQKTFKPPLLYDLTELQRDANRRFGWPASKTLEIAQALYEKRKLITYPRTDSRYLSRDIFKTLKGRLAKLDADPWSEFVKTAMASERNLFGRVINDAHVSDHHAIIPTGRDVPKEMDEDEGKLFDLIARRFISIFFPDQEVEFQTVTTRAEGQPFLSKGKKELAAGWSVIYTPLDSGKKKTKSSYKDDEYTDLPELNEGDEGRVKSAKTEEKQTTPPSRYTEASLLSAMENAGRFIEDEELKEQMKDSGLGTPATRAAIIERLIQVRYVRRTGRLLAPTEKGCALVDVLLGELASPEMTGRWEKELAEIGRGELDPQAFMNDIRQFVVKIVDASKAKVDGAHFPEEKRAKPGSAAPKEPVGICPQCGSKLFENSKTFYCARWRSGCRFSIWKDAASKSGGPEIDVNLAKKLLEGKPLVGHTGTLSLLKRAPYVEWQPRAGANAVHESPAAHIEPPAGPTDAP